MQIQIRVSEQRLRPVQGLPVACTLPGAVPRHGGYENRNKKKSSQTFLLASPGPMTTSAHQWTTAFPMYRWECSGGVQQGHTNDASDEWLGTEL
mmetsp:Transcript_36123/g.60317  ORF Transcript_36123/g.60317 Transcript_36123/m.60317 type:complete len:94 (+) Transcript_36123:62-343(+)